MKLSWALAMLVGVALVAVTITVVVTRESGDDRALAFTYATPDELVVMRQDKVISRVPGVYLPSMPMVWANSGQFVAWLSMAPVGRPDDRELFVVNVRTGAQRRQPCTRCASIAAVSDNGIMTSIANGESSGIRFTFRRFELETPGHGVEVNLATGHEYDIEAGTRSHLLVSRSGAYRQGEVGDAMRWVGVADPTDVAVGRYLDAKVAAGGELAAIAVIESVTGCDGALRIDIVGSAGGIRSTDLSATELPDFYMAVRDLWWDADERFHALLQAVPCDRSPVEPEPPNTLWSLDPASMVWTPDGAVPARAVRYIGQGAAILLKFTKCLEQSDCPAGTLSRYENGKQSPLAENVTAISSQPSGGGAGLTKPDFTDRAAAPACPTESRSGTKAEIRVLRNPMTCADAQRIYSEYTHSTLPAQGNAAHIETTEWHCATPTAGEVSRTGRIGSCQQAEPGAGRGWSFIVVQVR